MIETRPFYNILTWPLYFADRCEPIYNQDLAAQGKSHGEQESWAQGAQSASTKKTTVVLETAQAQTASSGPEEDEKPDQEGGSSREHPAKNAGRAPDQAGSTHAEPVIKEAMTQWTLCVSLIKTS